MTKSRFPVPLFVAIGMTRMMLGAGIALLVADRIRSVSRHRLGVTLTAIGAASTVPLMLAMRARRRALE